MPTSLPHPALSAKALRIAVVGTPRSGTTIMGDLLGVDSGSVVLTEPFSKIMGIEPIDRWNPFADDPASPWRPVIDAFMAGEYPRFRGVGPRWRRWLQGLRPGGNAWRYRAIRRKAPARLILKDPHLALATQYLIARHDFHVIHMVKHPAAFFQSLRRVEWPMNVHVADLVAQGALAAEAEPSGSFATEVAQVWNAINGHGLETAARFPDRATISRHEDFCRDPLVETGRLAAFLGIGLSPALRHAVQRATSGTVVVPADQTLHMMVRNVSTLAESWRGTIDPSDEAVLRAHCEPLYERIYDRPW